LSHRLVISSLLAAVVFSSSESARATSTAEDVYNTVDSFQPFGSGFQVSGVLAGATVSTGRFYFLGNESLRTSCERFAVLAMSKPGKFQFVITNPDANPVTCRLALRAP